MRTLLLAGTALLTLAGTAIPAAAQVSDNVIRIGVLNDRSGIYADLAGEGSAIAARMAAEEFGNKVAGAPVEIVVADHQNKADIAASKAREWVDTGGVDVIADVPNSAAALAVQGITKDKKRIFLMSGSAIGVLGMSCGLVLGVLFCLNIEGIQGFVEGVTHTKVFNQDVYFLAHVPAKIDWIEVAYVSGWALFVSLAASILPAWWASRLDPVEALRYE